MTNCFENKKTVSSRSDRGFSQKSATGFAVLISVAYCSLDNWDPVIYSPEHVMQLVLSNLQSSSNFSVLSKEKKTYMEREKKIGTIPEQAT